MQNPLIIAAYVAGLLLSVPVLVALVRLVFFFANITSTLKTVSDGLRDLVAEMKEFRHEKNDELQGVELSLTIIETDVNTLQEKAGLPVRAFPDRRTGAPDRRRA